MAKPAKRKTKRRKSTAKQQGVKPMARRKRRSRANTVSVQPTTNGSTAMATPSMDTLMQQFAAFLQSQVKPAAPQQGSKPEVVVEVQGPTPEELHGKDVLAIAQALKEAEAAAAADRDGIGADYARRAAQIRFVIWTRKYHV